MRDLLLRFGKFLLIPPPNRTVRSSEQAGDCSVTEAEPGPESLEECQAEATAWHIQQRPLSETDIVPPAYGASWQALSVMHRPGSEMLELKITCSLEGPAMLNCMSHMHAVHLGIEIIAFALSTTNAFFCPPLPHCHSSRLLPFSLSNLHFYSSHLLTSSITREVGSSSAALSVILCWSSIFSAIMKGDTSSYYERALKSMKEGSY